MIADGQVNLNKALNSYIFLFRLGNRPSCSAAPKLIFLNKCIFLFRLGNRLGYGAAPCNIQRRYANCPNRQGCHPESYVWHGTHRDMCRKRSRNCFVIRSPPLAKPRQRSLCRQGRFSSVDSECCCPPPEPVLRRPCRQIASSSTIDCCSPPEPAPLPAQLTCYPVRQPMPENPVCGLPRQRMCEPLRSRCPTQLPPILSAPMPPPYQPCYSNHYGQADHYAPVVQRMNECIDEPFDPYYDYDCIQRRPGADRLANFDLNRFDRDNVGRRRNVSIRTCVDYDYEPGHVVNHRQPYAFCNRPLYPNSRQTCLYPQFVPTRLNRCPSQRNCSAVDRQCPN